jgi:heme/copper-type cytochrome/quinol oxidase subunit 4
MLFLKITKEIEHLQAIGFIISLVVALVSVKYSIYNFVNSALTVIIGSISAKVIFVILFHHDNKKIYKKGDWQICELFYFIL